MRGAGAVIPQQGGGQKVQLMRGTRGRPKGLIAHLKLHSDPCYTMVSCFLAAIMREPV